MADEVVTVATFSTAAEAEAAKLDLEAEGILASVTDTDWSVLGIPSANVKLEVRQEDADKAMELLEHHGHTPLQDDDDEANAADAITCLECGKEMPDGATTCPACGWTYKG